MLLSIVLLTPLVGLALLLAIPSSKLSTLRWCANVIALVDFLLCLPLLSSFDKGAPAFQFVERLPWIPTLGAEYHLGIDGFSLLLVTMTTLLGFLAVLSSWNAIQHRAKEYYVHILLLQFATIGVFLALDFLLFFVFWELVLVPMYFLIAIWGGPRRIHAATKFIIYTLTGSVLMLLAGLLLYAEHTRQTGKVSFAISDLIQTTLPYGLEWWIFVGFFLGFAVKVPMFPFHTWLPDAHVEAPTAGSVLLAGVLLKMGTYGFLRFSLPLLPNAAKDPAVVSVVSGLSIVAIVYGALLCLMQKDWKKLVAYSSVSHMGFCTLGIFALNSEGISGSMLQQLNHGISTSMLFLLIGFVYERRHTRDIADYGGLFRVMPAFSAIFLITTLSSMGLPPLNGFIGEFAILQGVYRMSPVWAWWVGAGIVLGAAYLLWLFQRIAMGEVSELNAGLVDLSRREIAVAAPLLLLMFWIGLYPAPFFNYLNPAASQIVTTLYSKK